MKQCVNCLGAQVRFIEVGGDYIRVPCLTCDPNKAKFNVIYYGAEEEEPVSAVLADCFLYAAELIEKKKERKRSD